MANYIINDQGSSFLLTKDSAIKEYPRNYFSSNVNPPNVLNLSHNGEFIFSINVDNDTIDVDGQTVFATAQDLLFAIRPIFFWANAGVLGAVVDSPFARIDDLITGTVNNYNPTGLYFNGRIVKANIFLSSNGGSTITGILAPNPKVEAIINLFNIGDGINIGSVTYSSNNISSVSDNRMLFNIGNVIQQRYSDKISLRYEPSISKWILN